MTISLNSNICFDINPCELILQADIENGDSVSLINYKIKSYLYESLQIPKEINTNIDNICDMLTDEVCNNLYYYTM